MSVLTDGNSTIKLNNNNYFLKTSHFMNVKFISEAFSDDLKLCRAALNLGCKAFEVSAVHWHELEHTCLSAIDTSF